MEDRMSLTTAVAALRDPKSPQGKTVYPFFRTKLGAIYNADSLEMMERNLKARCSKRFVSATQSLMVG
jgi:hypothetical protein